MLLFWWKWKTSVESMGLHFSMLFTIDCAVNRTWICWKGWMEHGSIETEHGSSDQNMDPLKWSMDLVKGTWILLFHLKWNIDLKFLRAVCPSSIWLGQLLSVLAIVLHVEVHFWICPYACPGFDPLCFSSWPLLHSGIKPQCRSLYYGLILGLGQSKFLKLF